jgi:hypothetical protein
MFFKNYLFVLIFFLIANCTVDTLNRKQVKPKVMNSFINKGFTLIYTDKLFDSKIISKKLDNRSTIIFQKNLKEGTTVRITNILNNKSIIAKVGKESSYPVFNNSVITSKIAEEIELSLDEPYIEVFSIIQNSMFVAKKTKTYDEEKHVAIKVPVKTISINDLTIKKDINDDKINRKFSYIIKIADFYFKDTALIMMDRIKKETKIKNPKIENISYKQYRVFLGPFNNINSLQKSFNDIDILGFENIEIIKND